MVRAALLGEPRLSFAVMAGCLRVGGPRGGGGLFLEIYRESAPRLRGRVLSIYDASDRQAGSCESLLRQAPALDYREITLEAGRGHGLFYAPDPMWLDPVTDRANRRPTP